MTASCTQEVVHRCSHIEFVILSLFNIRIECYVLSWLRALQMKTVGYLEYSGISFFMVVTLRIESISKSSYRWTHNWCSIAEYSYGYVKEELYKRNFPVNEKTLKGTIYGVPLLGYTMQLCIFAKCSCF